MSSHRARAGRPSGDGATPAAEAPRALAHRLHSAAIHLLRLVRHVDVATDLGPAQLSALSVLVFGGPRSLGALAAAEHVRPPSMTRVVQELEAAGYVRAREWHPSQTLRDLPDGGVLLTLDVCRDQALRSWILSFGASAQVLSPETLVRETAEQFARAQARYMVRLGS